MWDYLHAMKQEREMLSLVSETPRGLGGYLYPEKSNCCFHRDLSRWINRRQLKCKLIKSIKCLKIWFEWNQKIMQIQVLAAACERLELRQNIYCAKENFTSCVDGPTWRFSQWDAALKELVVYSARRRWTQESHWFLLKDKHLSWCWLLMSAMLICASKLKTELCTIELPNFHQSVKFGSWVIYQACDSEFWRTSANVSQLNQYQIFC